MLDLLNRFSIVLILPAVALAFFVGAYFYFYQGAYEPSPSGQLQTQHITPPVSAFTNLESSSPVQEGTLLVDMGHSNNFSRDEISSFLNEITRRGYSLEFLEVSEDGRSLAEQLRLVDSFLVVQPSRPFNAEEVALVNQFVIEKGGKMLLIADPTRNHRMNSLSKEFGITFRPDYLHNSVEYDLNFQNIYVDDFKPDKLTDGLGRIALYAAGSLETSNGGLAIADGNTQSTFVERVEPLYPMARSEQGGVVAMTDLTFLIPPQSTIVNNPRLISNLADFLTSSERSFDLADFPYFFDETTEIILGRPSLLDAGVGMTSVLSGFQVASEIRNVPDPTSDLVYLGLYDDAPSVAQYLQLAGVEVGDELRTPSTPAIARDGSAVAVLYQDEQRDVLVILGDTPDDVERVLRQLENGSFRQGLVGDSVGVY